MNLGTVFAALLGPSWRTSLIGYLGTALVEVALALDALPAGPDGKYKVLWHVAAVLIGAFGRAVKDSTVTGGTVPATQEAKDRLSPPGGYASVTLLFLLGILTAALLFFGPTLAYPQTDAKYGGCLTKHPEVCFSPTVSVNLMAMSLKTGDLTSTFDPGVGYGVTFASSKWYKTGASGSIAFPTFEGARRAQPAATISFAEYVRVGVACPLYVRGGFRENGMLTFGLASDFNFGK